MPSDTKDNRNTSRPQAAAGAQQGQPAGQPPNLAPVFLAQNFVPPPSFQDVLSTPTADLYANKAQAAADYQNITHIILSDEERTALSGKRYPEINDVALLFAKGLDLHPEIVSATEAVTPAEQKREQAENAAAQSKAIDAFSTAIKATRTQES